MKKTIISIITAGLLALPSYGLVTQHTNTVALTLADVCDGTFNDFSFKMSGYDDQVFNYNYDVSLAGVSCVFRITKPIEGTIYLDVPYDQITVSTTNVHFSIARTNIPPPGNYYGELLSYETGTTNINRSIAQGKLPVTWSLYLNETNYFQRYTTNAVVGYVYIHPNWVNPPWVNSNSVNALSNYVVLVDGNLQTNLNTASNALRIAIGACETNINTLSNHVNSTFAKQADYQVTSNQADSARVIADGLNTRSSVWDSAYALGVGLNSRSSVWNKAASDLGGVSNTADSAYALGVGLNTRSNAWNTGAAIAAGLDSRSNDFNTAYLQAAGLTTRSSVWDKAASDFGAVSNLVDLHTGQITAISNTADGAAAVATGLNTRSNAWDTGAAQAAGLDSVSGTWSKAVSDFGTVSGHVDLIQSAQNAISNKSDTAYAVSGGLNTRSNVWDGAAVTSTGAYDIANGLNTRSNTWNGATVTATGAYNIASGLNSKSNTWDANDITKWSGNEATQRVFWVSHAAGVTNLFVGPSTGGYAYAVMGDYTQIENQVNGYPTWGSSNGYWCAHGDTTYYYLTSDTNGVFSGTAPYYISETSPAGQYAINPGYTGAAPCVYFDTTWQIGSITGSNFQVLRNGIEFSSQSATSMFFNSFLIGNGAGLTGLVEAVADGLNTRSSAWDLATANLPGVSNQADAAKAIADGLNTRSNTWNGAGVTATGAYDLAAGLETRSNAWNTGAAIAAGLDSKSNSWSTAADVLADRSNAWDAAAAGGVASLSVTGAVTGPITFSGDSGISQNDKTLHFTGNYTNLISTNFTLREGAATNKTLVCTNNNGQMGLVSMSPRIFTASPKGTNRVDWVISGLPYTPRFITCVGSLQNLLAWSSGSATPPSTEYCIDRTAAGNMSQSGTLLRLNYPDAGSYADYYLDVRTWGADGVTIRSDLYSTSTNAIVTINIIITCYP